jgi:hypothetical protein
MVALIAFLGLYLLATGIFFIALMRWTIRTERGACACRGTLGQGSFAFTHGSQMCYPAVEGLHPLSR